MRELRIRLGSSRNANSADHLWREAGGPPRSERPWSGSLPEADRHVVFVPPERATVVEITPPPLSPRKLEQALPWLVEAQLIEAVEHYELVRQEAGSGLLRVVALERDWLAEVRRQLAAIGHGEVDWVLAGTHWRLPDGDWAIRAEGEQVLLALGGSRVIAAATATLNETLRSLLGAEGSTGVRRPAAIHHLGLDASALAAMEPVAAGAGISLVAATANELPDEFDGDVTGAPTLFAQRRSALRKAFGELASWPRWRAAAIIVALLVGVELVAPLLRWGQLAFEEKQLREAATSLFRDVAGERAVVVDPWLQMRRLDQGVQHAQGRAVADDLLPLLDTVARLMPAGVGPASEVRFAERRLELVFIGDAAPAVEAALPELIQALRAKGWKALGESDAAARLTLRVERA